MVGGRGWYLEVLRAVLFAVLRTVGCHCTPAEISMLGSLVSALVARSEYKCVCTPYAFPAQSAATIKQGRIQGWSTYRRHEKASTSTPIWVNSNTQLYYKRCPAIDPTTNQ